MIIEHVVAGDVLTSERWATQCYDGTDPVIDVALRCGLWVIPLWTRSLQPSRCSQPRLSCPTPSS